MVHLDDPCNEDEDEWMLNGAGSDAEKEKLIQKNGSALIDVDVDVQQSFSGLTMAELVKFVNDPFWKWLRWILFILFWGLWVAMLVSAISRIMDAPKCVAWPPHAWYRIGPLVTIDEPRQDYKLEVDTLQKLGAKGVIYKLPAEDTYRVDTNPVENKIKELVGTFNAKNIKVIIDLTPNFVTKNDQLFQDALKKENSNARSAFVWKQSESAPTNWLALEGDSAWKEITPRQFVLAQFGTDRFDLQLNEPLAKEKLKGVLRHLAQLGVRGFRLANAKHFIINSNGKDDVRAEIDGKNLKNSSYDFWTHSYTTYQDGLGTLLRELVFEVRNATNGEGFLSVSDDISDLHFFTDKDESWFRLGVDIPLYGDLEKVLRQPIEANSAKVIREAFGVAYSYKKYFDAPTGGKSRMQLPFNKDSLGNVGASVCNIFMFLLPGVPVVPLDVFNSNPTLTKRLQLYRATPSYRRGWFGIYNDANSTSIAYFRTRPGHVGYFVALSLADQTVEADFSEMEDVAEELTVALISDNYHVPHIGIWSKIRSNAVPLSARSALMATYVAK